MNTQNYTKFSKLNTKLFFAPLITASFFLTSCEEPHKPTLIKEEDYVIKSINFQPNPASFEELIKLDHQYSDGVVVETENESFEFYLRNTTFLETNDSTSTILVESFEDEEQNLFQAATIYLNSDDAKVINENYEKIYEETLKFSEEH